MLRASYAEVRLDSRLGQNTNTRTDSFLHVVDLREILLFGKHSKERQVCVLDFALNPV